MKQYHAVNGKHVRVMQLRETAKFLIDGNGVRFKKTGKPDCIASNKGYSNWTSTGYEIYPFNHDHPLRLIKEEKQGYFCMYVKEKLEKLCRDRNMTYERAKEINRLLGFELEEPN